MPHARSLPEAAVNRGNRGKQSALLRDLTGSIARRRGLDAASDRRTLNYFGDAGSATVVGYLLSSD
jgi:hypothetical protein